MASSSSDPAAKQRLRDILEHGTVTWSQHALERLRERGIDTADIQTALKGGVVEPAHYENGAWRHRVRGRFLEIVIQFKADDHLLVVTAWSIRQSR